MPDQHAYLDFFSASSVKQQSTGTQVAPFRHIYPDDYEPTSFCSYSFYVSGEAANTNSTVFGLKQQL